jgi:hypothetical protein
MVNWIDNFSVGEFVLYGDHYPKKAMVTKKINGKITVALFDYQRVAMGNNTWRLIYGNIGEIKKKIKNPDMISKPWSCPSLFEEGMEIMQYSKYL